MAETKKVEPDNRPNSQIDLERRLERDHLPDTALVDNESDPVRNPEKVVTGFESEDIDTSGYLGVSPEYMNYANETEKPHTADEGPEAESLKRLQGGVAGVRRTKDLRQEPATEVGVTDTETVNTATSGEGYSAKLVDAPKDFQGTASFVEPEASSTAPKTTSRTAPKATTKSNS